MLDRGNGDGGTSRTSRCSQCRSETTPVSVDAGAGASLPLFVVGHPIAGGTGRIVQVIRQPLEGELCLNCGLLHAAVKLSTAEIAEYKAQSKDLAEGQLISPRSPTWIKKPRQ